jgi:hypothetical protein
VKFPNYTELIRVEKIKLLITARDPATADAIRPLLVGLQNKIRFQVEIVAENPAFKLLRLDAEQENIPISLFSQCLSKQELVARCRELVLAKKPDAVLTGISGPDIGVDEGILSALEECSIPSYSIQSYWGDINETLTGRPQTVFVIDEYAASITRQRCLAEIVITGALKYANFEKIDPLILRKQFTDTVIRRPDEKLLGFFGQPLSEIQGYSDTIDMLARVTKELAIKCRIVYRPHPKETQKSRRETLSLFQARGMEVIVDENEDGFPALCGVDIVISAFSTCGYDAIYLNKWSRLPLNTTLFLSFDQQLLHWYEDYSKLLRVPMANEGIVAEVFRAVDLGNAIHRGLDSQYQKKVWRKIKKGLSHSKQSVKIIYDKIYHDQVTI